MLPPTFDDDPGFFDRIEDLTVQKLVAQFRVEALAIAVLLRTTRRDVGGLGADGSNPFAHRLGDELKAVVGTNVPRHAAQDEEIRQNIDYVRGSQLATDPDRDALAMGEAFILSMREEGTAVVYTALTLALGVGSWAFSGLKFQADMGWLLGFLVLVNALGAVTALPAMAVVLDRVLPRRRKTKEKAP